MEASSGPTAGASWPWTPCTARPSTKKVVPCVMLDIVLNGASVPSTEAAAELVTFGTHCLLKVFGLSVDLEGFTETFLNFEWAYFTSSRPLLQRSSTALASGLNSSCFARRAASSRCDIAPAKPSSSRDSCLTSSALCRLAGCGPTCSRSSWFALQELWPHRSSSQS